MRELVFNRSCFISAVERMKIMPLIICSTAGFYLCSFVSDLSDV